MIRLLYIAGLVALLAAGSLLGSCIRQWLAGSQPHETSWDSPSAIQMFQERNSKLQNDDGERTPPLIKQAEIFSARFTSAAPVLKEEHEVPPIAAAKRESSGPASPIRPPTPSVQFKLVGTSYYPNQPKRSMALICDLVASESEQRWVKEGAQVGHFIIQEIRHGAIVYRDGDNLREMAVESGVSLPSIVRDIRLGDRKVSAAVNSTDVVSPMSPGPNNVEIVGGN